MMKKLVLTLLLGILVLEQAVEAYTLGSAFAEFGEQEKGSIKKGKLADIAVLSQNDRTSGR